MSQWNTQAQGVFTGRLKVIRSSAYIDHPDRVKGANHPLKLKIMRQHLAHVARKSRTGSIRCHHQLLTINNNEESDSSFLTQITSRVDLRVPHSVSDSCNPPSSPVKVTESNQLDQLE